MPSAGAPIFELILDGESLQGMTLRHLLSVELKESMDALDALTVRLGVPEDAKQVLRLTRPGAQFTVRLGYGGDTVREVCGDILEVSHARSTSGWEVTLQGVDSLHRLKKKKLTRVWEGNHADVIASIATECGLKPQIEGVAGTGQVKLQLNQEVSTVLANLARENNYFVRIENGNVLRFGRHNLAYQASPVVLVWGEHLEEVSVSYSLNDIVTDVTVKGQDYAKDTWVEGKATVDKLRKISGGLTAVELAQMAFGDVSMFLDNANQSQTSQAEAKAQSEMQDRAEKFLTGSCKCPGMPEACSGSDLIIEGAGWPLSGKFLIKETTHALDPGSGYTTSISFSSDSLPPGHERWWGGA